MRYSIHWHDCEDDRSGQPVEVDAVSPVEAYLEGVRTIRAFSPYLAAHFVNTDIEYLSDEDGKHHYPDFFLSDDLDDKL